MREIGGRSREWKGEYRDRDGANRGRGDKTGELYYVDGSEEIGLSPFAN